MARKETLIRYTQIINKVRKHPASFKEIKESVENHFESLGILDQLNFSKRTFIRDLAEIASLYNIEIEYNTSKRGYEIVHEDDSNSTHNLLEAFDIFNVLNLQDSVSEYIHFENRKPKGTENINGILQAIKNHMELKFEYQSFWSESPTFRIVHPLALKEFKNRWYIVSKDCKDGNIKTFALDRLKELEISKKKFTYPSDFNIVEHYKHCFGIISPNKEEPEEVILSFHPHKGKYIKSLPLHHSQKELIDNEHEYRISLKVFTTLDFVMEILSHGNEVKVIEPESLKMEITKKLESTLKQYNTN